MAANNVSVNGLCTVSPKASPTSTPQILSYKRTSSEHPDTLPDPHNLSAIPATTTNPINGVNYHDNQGYVPSDGREEVPTNDSDKVLGKNFLNSFRGRRSSDNKSHSPENGKFGATVLEMTDRIDNNENKMTAEVLTKESEEELKRRESVMKKMKEEEELIKREQMDGDVEEKLLYTVDDNPPWYTCVVLGLQHYLMMVESTVSIPYLLTPLLCLPSHHPARALIASTIIFVSGLVTLFQTTLGIRLPIVQGGTHGFLGPILSILALLPCPPEAERAALSDEELEDLWTFRMRNIQGAICVASIFQVVVGATGAIGVLLRWITPLVIVPTITLIGFSLYPVATAKCASNWGIAALTIVLLIVFSQYLGEVPVPFPIYSGGKWQRGHAYVFKLVPVVLAVGIAWFVCWILTVTDVMNVDDAARTDNRLSIVWEAPWFRVPYPCQWGIPQVTIAGAVGVLAGILASIVESIGDYYACARIAGAPPPPPHAINRGIFTEGVGTLLAGLFGTGSGTTSYSQNIGAIAVTKVGSRRVIQYAGAIMLVCGLMGKVGAVFIIIPEPIIGGIFVIVFSMITAVGLSALQHVRLSSPRNLFVLGFSLFTGLALPMWIREGDNKLLLQTGVTALDQVLVVLLSTSMFVGGLLGFVLDNTIPGTARERGVDKWRAQLQVVSHVQGPVTTCYQLPIGMDAINRWSWTKYVPILPTFKGWEAIRRDMKSGRSS